MPAADLGDGADAVLAALGDGVLDHRAAVAALHHEGGEHRVWPVVSVGVDDYEAALAVALHFGALHCLTSVGSGRCRASSSGGGFFGGRGGGGGGGGGGGWGAQEACDG